MNMIGLDIGTTTICGVLYSMEEKKAVKTVVKENCFLPSIPAEYIQDPAEILKAIYQITDELIEASENTIGGISISSQMHGILYVDIEGNPVTPLYTWQNPRGLKVVDGRTIAATVSEKLGYPVYTGYGIVTHYALEKSGQLPDSAEIFCNIGDFVGMRLAGRNTPVTDITLGASMGICDIEKGTLSESLSNLDLEHPDMIPAIVSSTEVLGNYRGIPVIQAIGDNQASYLGSVKKKNTTLLLNYGTSGQISLFQEAYHTYPRFETRPLGNEGYIYVAFSLCGGKSYKVLSDFFTAAASMFSDGKTKNAMKIMDEMEIDFSDEEIECLPLFLGERGVDDSYAYFRNITDQNFTPANLVKGLVQGMVQEMYRYYQTLPAHIDQGIETLAGAGNGIRKNRHLIQAAAKSYGRPVQLLNLSEESCIGAAINAGKGIGLFKDYDEGAQTIVEYVKSPI